MLKNPPDDEVDDPTPFFAGYNAVLLAFSRHITNRHFITARDFPGPVPGPLSVPGRVLTKFSGLTVLYGS